MAIGAISRSSKLPKLALTFLLRGVTRIPINNSPHICYGTQLLPFFVPQTSGCIGSLTPIRQFHDGRPRGSLWRGKKLLGKEALFVIQGLKRFKDDAEKMDKFVKSHVLRLLKLDMVAVLNELERQEEVHLAVKTAVNYLLNISQGHPEALMKKDGEIMLILVSTLAIHFHKLFYGMFWIIHKQDWYKPDVFIYKDLIVALAKCKKMDEAMKLWDSMRKECLFPDFKTYAEVIRGFLRDGSPADAMNIYEDMKQSPDPPEALPFRILLKGLLPHPLLRNKVKQDFEEIFPEEHVYDPPEEIFGLS